MDCEDRKDGEDERRMASKVFKSAGLKPGLYREGRSLPAGGWPRLNSEKRLWVPHPCGFQGAVSDS